MNTPRLISLTALAPILALMGCNMAPRYERPSAPVAPQWPQGAAYAPAETTATPAGLPWPELVQNTKLKALITQALGANRDLRATMASVMAARAQYRVQRSALLPTLNAGVSSTTARTNGNNVENYDAQLGISAFEIDLFGRVRNESRAALESWLATQEGARAARISLVAETATAYATFAADQERLTLAQSTLANAERALRITRSLNQAGLAAGLDVQQALTVVERTRSDIASYTTQVAQDRNALELLIAGPVDSALLPVSLAEVGSGIAQVPAGLSSEVLLARPDVLQSEHLLKAANADIGAARAALFPTISLTSAIGVASSALSSLFDNGNFSASVTPSARYSIFGGGKAANLDAAKAQRDRAVAQYEYAVQTAFKEVSDALARSGTIGDQIAAQRALIAASQRYYDLAEQRYRGGISSYQEPLDAQRTLYSAQLSAIATELAAVTNRITLYRVIGADF